MKKKFTFGSRQEIKNENLSSLIAVDNVVIKSDIDEIPNKPKFAYIIIINKLFLFFLFINDLILYYFILYRNTNAKRFNQDKIYNAPYPEEICKNENFYIF